MDHAAQRGADLEREMVIEAIENLIVAEDPADRALARAEVAEMVQGEDAGAGRCALVRRPRFCDTMRATATC